MRAGPLAQEHSRHRQTLPPVGRQAPLGQGSVFKERSQLRALSTPGSNSEGVDRL